MTMLPRLVTVAIAWTAFLALSATAAIVAPVPQAGAPGDQGVESLIEGNPILHQMQIGASQLASIPEGSTITGLRWRLAPGQQPWDRRVLFFDYEIVVAGAANPVNSMSTTFADNLREPVRVRDGLLELLVGSFPDGASPNTFGVLIPFQAPYVYLGGDLVLEFRHSGGLVFGARFPRFLRLLDGLGNTAPGYGTEFRALEADNLLNAATVATRLAPSFTVTQLEFTPPSAEAAPLGISDVTLLPERRSARAGRLVRLRVMVSNDSTSDVPVTVNFSSSDETILPRPESLSFEALGKRNSRRPPRKTRQTLSFVLPPGSGGEAQLTASFGSLSNSCAVTIRPGQP